MHVITIPMDPLALCWENNAVKAFKISLELDRSQDWAITKHKKTHISTEKQ